MSPCNSNQIRNPLTGRCVKKTGAIGKQILEKRLPPCKSNQMRNPLTGRCVKKSGVIGKHIVEKRLVPCTPKQIRNTKTNRCVNKSGKIGRKLIAAQKEKKKQRKPRLREKKPLSIRQVITGLHRVAQIESEHAANRVLFQPQIENRQEKSEEQERKEVEALLGKEIAPISVGLEEFGFDEESFITPTHTPILTPNMSPILNKSEEDFISKFSIQNRQADIGLDDIKLREAQKDGTADSLRIKMEVLTLLKRLGYNPVKFIAKGSFGQVFLLSKTVGRAMIKEYVAKVTKESLRDTKREKYMHETFYKTFQHNDFLLIPKLYHFDSLQTNRRVVNLFIMEKIDGSMEAMISNSLKQGIGEDDLVNSVVAIITTILDTLRIHNCTHGDLHWGNIGFVETPWGEDSVMDNTFQEGEEEISFFHPRISNKLCLIDFGYSTNKGFSVILDLFQTIRVCNPVFTGDTKNATFYRKLQAALYRLLTTYLNEKKLIHKDLMYSFFMQHIYPTLNSIFVGHDFLNLNTTEDLFIKLHSKYQRLYIA